MFERLKIRSKSKRADFDPDEEFPDVPVTIGFCKESKPYKSETSRGPENFNVYVDLFFVRLEQYRGNELYGEDTYIVDKASFFKTKENDKHWANFEESFDHEKGIGTYSFDARGSSGTLLHWVYHWAPYANNVRNLSKRRSQR